MACYGAKFAYGASFVGLGAALAGVVAALVEPTPAGEVAAFFGLMAAGAAHISAALSLAECLEQAGRPDDAAELRREVQELEREMERLRQLVE